jgi:hypothetical protein
MRKINTNHIINNFYIGNPVYEISNSIGNIDPTETSNDTTLYASQG